VAYLAGGAVQLASAASRLPGGKSGSPVLAPPISVGSCCRKRKQRKYEARKYEAIAIGAVLKGKVMRRSGAPTQKAAGFGGPPCREPRPLWIPRLTSSLTASLPCGTSTGCVQLQPSMPNELGSALAGVATARAAPSVIAALNTTLVINNVLP
jgi:hypothetical protein